MVNDKRIDKLALTPAWEEEITLAPVKKEELALIPASERESNLIPAWEKDDKENTAYDGGFHVAADKFKDRNVNKRSSLQNFTCN